MEKIAFVLRPLGFFLLSTMLFLIGIYQHNFTRGIYAFLYTAAALLCFSYLQGFPPEVATFFLGWTVHTSGILLLGETSLGRFSLSSVDELKTAFFIWTNFRGVKRFYNVITPENSSVRPRLSFAMRRTLRTLSLLALNHGMTELLVKPTLASLGIIRSDFSPAKRGLVPPVGRIDLILRLIMSTLWVWKTYFALTTFHDAFAIIFVSILHWNDESEWPPLFGSISEAISISRFWGSFWHRLHVLPFLRLQPSISYHGYCPQWICQNTMVRNGIRALWIFLCSATCHGALNHVVYGRAYLEAELRFFLFNWCICLAETVLKRVNIGIGRYSNVRNGAQNGTASLLGRIGGHALVLGFFFCTVPAWRYPLIYDSIPGVD